MVHINGKDIDYENYMLKDGDIIEIVQFMGGGCGTSLMYR